MKRVIGIAAGAVALIAIVFLSLRAGGREKGVKVYVAAAESRVISRLVKASGQVDPRVKVNISAHVVGKIEELFVKEGDNVAAGAPFLRLERDAFLAIRNAGAAQREIQRSQLRQAEIALEDSRLKLERQRRLSQEKIASPEQLEAAELQHSSSLQALEQARQALSQAEADFVKAEDDLAKTTLYAPIAGRVIALNAEKGEVVVSGTMNNPGSVIGTIADLSEILVEVDVDENEIVHISGGQPAQVKVDAMSEREFTARVVEIGSSGYSKPQQPDVTFFKVKLLLDEPAESLRAGMSARAEINTETRPDALVVPIQAVIDRLPPGVKAKSGEEKPEEVPSVFVVEKGKVHQRTVATGISDTVRVEIREGIAAGDQVVTGPYRSLKSLKDGDAVRIVEESADRAGDKKTADEGEDDEAAKDDGTDD